MVSAYPGCPGKDKPFSGYCRHFNTTLAYVQQKDSFIAASSSALLCLYVVINTVT